MRPGTDAAILRGYVQDEFVKAALERVLQAAEKQALHESTERFLSREWREKAREYERERDAFQSIFTALAAQPCAFPGAMSTCMDRVRSRDPANWCRPCWARHVLVVVELP